MNQTQCHNCASPVAAGEAFCGACGAKQQQAGCPKCGAALAENAAFCGACGAAVSQAEPAATADPAVCASCGAAMREGARFCRICGQAAGAAPAAAAGTTGSAQPGPVSGRTLIDQLTWSSAAAGAGFLIAFVSAFLPWASAFGVDVDPFDAGARFRLGDVLNADSIDGYAVILVALAGLVALGASLLGRIAAETGRYAVAGAGAMLVLLAVIEMQFVVAQAGLGASNIGFGLYGLLIGGALAAASPWIPARSLRGQ